MKIVHTKGIPGLIFEFKISNLILEAVIAICTRLFKDTTIDFELAERHDSDQQFLLFIINRNECTLTDIENMGNIFKFIIEEAETVIQINKRFDNTKADLLKEYNKTKLPGKDSDNIDTIISFNKDGQAPS